MQYTSFTAADWLCIPLLILSLITFAIAVERFYYYRINRKGSRTFFHGVYHAAVQKDWDTIGKLCKEFPSAVSRIVESGIENAGTETAMKGAFSDRMSMEAINFRRYLDYLSAIVTIAPLLGLLGTVTGMIQTFSVLDEGGGAGASHGWCRCGTRCNGNGSLRCHHCILRLHLLQPSARCCRHGYRASLRNNCHCEKRKLGGTMNFSNHRLKKKPEFMIIPMIDIIFFLLVFFMMNSLQTVAQKALAVQLPQAQSATAPAQLPIIMTLDEEGHITIDNNPVSITESAAIMKRHMQENPNAAVVLQADKRTAHGQVVAVMDMLKGAGVKRLSIAAEQKG